MGKDKEERSFQLSEKYYPNHIPEANEVGLYARRGCTDFICGFLLYATAWAAMMSMAFVAYSQGDPRRLMHGMDRFGNLCGYTLNDTVTVDISVNGSKLAWSDFSYIMYPLPSPENCLEAVAATKGKTCEDLVKDSLKQGICTYRCLDAGETVTWYDGTEYFGDTRVSFSLPFETSGFFHRCIPAGDVLDANVGEIFGLAGTAQAAFTELERSWPVVAACAVGAVFLSFFWLFILRRTVKPTVFVSLFLLFIGSGFAVYICYTNWNRGTGSTKSTWFVFFIATAAWFCIYTCLCIFLFKSINVACDTIEEASKIPLALPGMTLIPPCITLLIVPVFAFHVVTAMFIQTIGDVQDQEMTVYPDQTLVSGGLNATLDITVQALQTEHWQAYAHIFNVFMFFWSMGLLNAIGFLIIAFCAVFWYWSYPGDRKCPQAGVKKGFYFTVRYHLGTLMIGSLIVAVIQTIRFVLNRLEGHMRNFSENDTVQGAIKCIHCCVQCCLAYFERVIKFINRNAYIMTAMAGDNFCSGARRALFLLLRHAFCVMAVNFISDWVMFFGKLQIMAVSVGAGWALITQLDVLGPGEDTPDCIITLICIAIVAYIIASVFVSVFSVCVDSVLLSFCHDLDINNGFDKPYYLPSDLQRSLNAHNQMGAGLDQPLMQR
eukprot:TRINITY_DN4819_c1_g1_i1.p1 TRINITY_DN4819_c1_g1~~TRINITY_DN4819_c1_g1_i1.p1  ORF type:complete len:660 (+),score=53.46 TRINITY_DN4819_c1_g1_i1:43-2022(+)